MHNFTFVNVLGLFSFHTGLHFSFASPLSHLPELPLLLRELNKSNYLFFHAVNIIGFWRTGTYIMVTTISPKNDKHWCNCFYNAALKLHWGLHLYMATWIKIKGLCCRLFFPMLFLYSLNCWMKTWSQFVSIIYLFIFTSCENVLVIICGHPPK